MGKWNQLQVSPERLPLLLHALDYSLAESKRRSDDCMCIMREVRFWLQTRLTASDINKVKLQVRRCRAEPRAFCAPWILYIAW